MPVFYVISWIKMAYIDVNTESIEFLISHAYDQMFLRRYPDYLVNANICFEHVLTHLWSLSMYILEMASANIGRHPWASL